uniref:Uncharacterized protein n=1 Tax=Romanomermis culicivorax TaxID=13658 RepID=A0A915JIR5_ROMCU
MKTAQELLLEQHWHQLERFHQESIVALYCPATIFELCLAWFFYPTNLAPRAARRLRSRIKNPKKIRFFAQQVYLQILLFRPKIMATYFIFK